MTRFRILSLMTKGLFFVLLIAWPTLGFSQNTTRAKLGIVVALSGKAQVYGQAVLQGAQLAVDEINRQGGVLNTPMTLIAIDNESSAIHAREAALEAVYQKVIGVVGAVWSTHSLAIAPVFQKYNIPMISPGSTAPEVTQIGDFIFRDCYTDDFQGKLMADFAFYSLDHRRVAILSNISETYSQRLAQYFSTHFKLNGGDVISEAGYMGRAVDFRDILTPLISLKPDAVFIPGYSRDSGLIIKQAHTMGIHTTFLGGDAWETTIKTYAGAALEGSYFSTFWHPSVPYPRNKAFLSRYRSTHGDQGISAYVPHAYDAVWLFAEAIKRAKSLDPKKIREALAATQGFEGATGRIAFNAYGDPVKKSASILQYSKGRWQFYKAYEPK